MSLWLLTDWVRNGRPGLVGLCIGALAGLVTISPVAGYVQVWAAFAWAQVSSAALCWHRFIPAMKHLPGFPHLMLCQALHLWLHRGLRPLRVRWDICGAKLHMLGAKVIGIVACIVCYSSCELLKKIGLDDALDVRRPGSMRAD